MAVAIVTGASKGLGRELAGGLARTGWTVVIDGRDPDRLSATVRDLGASALGRVVAVPGDLADPDHRRELVEVAIGEGGLDLVVNNAGTLGPSPLPALSSVPLAAVRATLEVNVVAQLGLIQAALPALLSSTEPRVINVTSDAGIEAYPGWGVYGASKAALEQLGAVLAAEHPELLVWTVDPGDLRTDMYQAAFAGEDISDRPDPSSVVEPFLALVAGRRPSGRYRLSDLGREAVGQAARCDATARGWAGILAWAAADDDIDDGADTEVLR